MNWTAYKRLRFVLSSASTLQIVYSSVVYFINLQAAKKLLTMCYINADYLVIKSGK